MSERFKVAWNAFFGGPVGPIGWCGQVGYWWTRPCGHPAAGCGWFDGQQVRPPVDAEYTEYVDKRVNRHESLIPLSAPKPERTET